MDREGRDGFDLLDEIEQKLGLTVTPQTWPIGMGTAIPGSLFSLQKEFGFVQCTWKAE